MSSEASRVSPIQHELQWASVLVRLAMGSLLITAAAIKVPNGIGGTVAYYGQLFEKSLLALVFGDRARVGHHVLRVYRWILGSGAATASR